ncbi:flagellar basal body rod protein FlgB [Aquifex aeolicus]|uniref:Flagellar basal body rod protein FlgB n=1 Tax=Aquifex aeolicus (strain VF5) TaxID=224324 RepID=FLGB_AQUAE|nr:flagellar basal body rod protein FlgB [Aquifex aeolicus]O67244.1 RecName: Full=Flagellar basal body rod protein FlgB [Aquifex aeolicus VF5]AAC07194.1 flagellar basal body rod protein FlgB [Aquifex aeolicus VF5]
MDLFRGVNLYKKYINFTWKRHKVLLGNLANADTPNYKRRDLIFFLEPPTIPLKTTHNKHVKNFRKFEERLVVFKNGLQGNDRNNVSIERELSEIVKNKLAYETYLKFAMGSLNTLNRVIKGRAE